MNAPRLTRWIMGMAVAAVPMTALTVHGQQLVDNGRARDANPLVGSGGSNTHYTYDPTYYAGQRAFVGGDPIRGQIMNGNNVVTGNVTGGRQFRGHVPYGAAGDFRGRVGGSNFDTFIAGSSGAPGAYQIAPQAPTVQPYYGARRAAPPPPGSTEIGGTGTYIVRPTLPPPGTTASQLNTAPLANPMPGSMSLESIRQMPGPVDAQTLLPEVTRSPLSPLSQIQPYGTIQTPFDSGVSFNYRLTERQIRQLQSDLIRSAGITPPDDSAQPEDPGGTLSRPAPQPFDAPQNPTIGGTPMGAAITNPALNPAQPGMGSRFAVAPEQQSTQYSELSRRLERYYESRLKTDEDRNREFLAQLRKREEARQNAAKTPDVPAMPDYGAIEQQLQNIKPLPANERPQPLEIKSVAEGIKAEGLRNLLASAEQLVRDGQYGKALEAYEAAAKVAGRGNGLILMGQANAALAAGYYKRSEAAIRQAIASDPRLTIVRFDLRATVGRDQLAKTVADLKELARRQENDPTPAFLLAYLAYNTGNGEQAAMYLDLAQKRAGDKDEFYKLLRERWVVEPAAPTTQPAK